MHWFTTLFVLMLLASTMLRSWLNQRQIAAVHAHRDQVPKAFEAQVDLESHRKAADYTIALAGLNRWDLLLDAILALALTLGGGLDIIDRLWRGVGWSPALHGTAVVLSTLMLLSVIGLPLSVYRTFGIEARFGFNRMTPGLFIIDLVKGLALTLILGGPLVFVILFLSSAFFPANLMLEPAASVADYNPLSFIVEGLREPIIASFDGGDELLAVVSVLGVMAFGFWLCALALRGRVRRGT